MAGDVGQVGEVAVVYAGGGQAALVDGEAGAVLDAHRLVVVAVDALRNADGGGNPLEGVEFRRRQRPPVHLQVVYHPVEVVLHAAVVAGADVNLPVVGARRAGLDICVLKDEVQVELRRQAVLGDRDVVPQVRAQSRGRLEDVGVHPATVLVGELHPVVGVHVEFVSGVLRVAQVSLGHDVLGASHGVEPHPGGYGQVAQVQRGAVGQGDVVADPVEGAGVTEHARG